MTVAPRSRGGGRSAAAAVFVVEVDAVY